ncbi:MAG TPA: hypothetical protein VEZ24_11735 [Microvirga sp.]|nr:hypothetical protein [Microvirga sp.]
MLFSTLALWFPGNAMAQGLSLEKVEALSQGALPQVREFITRKLGCSHWEVADTRDRLKAAEAKRATRHLRCNDLGDDEVFLRKIYAQHAASIRALDSASEKQISLSEKTDQPPPVQGAGF